MTSTPEVPGPSRSWDPPAAAPSSLLDLRLCLSVAVAASASSFLTQPCTLSQHILQEHIDIWATSGRALQLAAVGNLLLLLVLHATRRPVRGILLARQSPRRAGLHSLSRKNRAYGGPTYFYIKIDNRGPPGATAPYLRRWLPGGPIIRVYYGKIETHTNTVFSTLTPSVGFINDEYTRQST